MRVSRRAIDRESPEGQDKATIDKSTANEVRIPRIYVELVEERPKHKKVIERLGT
jgi:hypothetical protein